MARKQRRKGELLTEHPNGQWCKWIRNETTGKRKMYFFGTDYEAAKKRYDEEKGELAAGRIPKTRQLSPGKATTEQMVNSYIHRCKLMAQAGELSLLSFGDYKAIGTCIVEHLGRETDPEQLRPQDFAAFRFAMTQQYSLARWSKIVAVTKAAFRWAFEAEVIDHLPRFGPDFKVASDKQRRKQKNERASKVLSAKQIKAMLDSAGDPWIAIILLCTNGGLGNSDIARLKWRHVRGEWLDFARGKTGIERRIWLWPETLEAIAKLHRPNEDDDDLIFRSADGGAIVRLNANGSRTDNLAHEFRRLRTVAGIKRKGSGLYALRHTFQNVADQVKDPIATAAIMGHSDGSMASHYRESIDDARLKAVCAHVRQWLFGKTPRASKAKPQFRVVG